MNGNSLTLTFPAGHKLERRVWHFGIFVLLAPEVGKIWMRRSICTATPLYWLTGCSNKSNIMLWRGRLGSSNWEHQLIGEMFPEVINQARCSFVFSWTFIQLVKVPPGGHSAECRFKIWTSLIWLGGYVHSFYPVHAYTIKRWSECFVQIDTICICGCRKKADVLLWQLGCNATPSL